MTIQVGSQAPSFTAQAYLAQSDQFKEISLEDYKGKWVCLYFYPMDFTFVCPTEIAAFDQELEKFQERDCEVLTCSCDSQYVHKGWCDANPMLKGLKQPMLADTTKRISMDYGVLLADKGVSLRGTFIIDPQGVIRWVNINDLPVGRNVSEVLRVLDALQSGGLTACNWKPGDDNIKP